MCDTLNICCLTLCKLFSCISLYGVINLNRATGVSQKLGNKILFSVLANEPLKLDSFVLNVTID